MCPVCGGNGWVQAAPIHPASHGVSWKQSVIVPCFACCRPEPVSRLVQDETAGAIG